MKCPTCNADMALTKSLSFGTGPLKLIYECSGSVVHAVVHDKAKQCDDLKVDLQLSGGHEAHSARLVSTIAPSGRRA